LDRWSWVHLGAGLLLGLTGLDWRIGVALIVGFEGLESILRRIKTNGEGLFEYESWPNVAADIVIGSAGFLATLWASPYHWPFT